VLLAGSGLSSNWHTNLDNCVAGQPLARLREQSWWFSEALGVSMHLILPRIMQLKGSGSIPLLSAIF